MTPTSTPSPRPRSCVPWLGITNGLLLTAGVLWLGLGNWAANQKFQPITQELNRMYDRFPPAKANASAREVQRLTTTLGMGAIVAAPGFSNPFSPTPQDARAFGAIQKPLRDYLDSLIAQATDQVQPLPAPLRRYLNQYSPNLANLRTSLLTQELPQWELYDLRQALDPSFPLPAFLSLLNLHHLLLLDALEQDRLGRPQVALDSLEASWKLNQSIASRPDLLSKLVNLISNRYQYGVLRRMDRLPPEWRKRLVEMEGRSAFLTSLQLEALTSLLIMQAYPSRGVMDGSGSSGFNTSPLARVLQPFQQPYFTLSSIDLWQVSWQTHQQLANQDFCQIDLMQATRQARSRIALWNPAGRFPAAAFITQWYKLQKREIHWELTQHVLAAKSAALQQKRWPTSLPGSVNSKVCQPLRWRYQVSADGQTMTIAAENLPVWATEDRNTPKPLPYAHRASLTDLGISR